MANSMNLHDVLAIEIGEPTRANGHAWRTVKITMAPIVELPDGSWGKVKSILSIAMHCAEENRPIDIEVKS